MEIPFAGKESGQAEKSTEQTRQVSEENHPP
jgi:hypothetical protein